jgi:carboxylate-amine ligase
MHINLPFADDDEFARLHAAIRVALPLIPALSAASPLEQGRPAEWLDGRLRYYRDNQRRIPGISGAVIPEAIDGIADYHARILEPMYRDIEPWDPAGELQEDWLNSRGAIARFERQTIEIRIIDLQECPAADLAIAELVVALVRALYDEELASFSVQQAVSTVSLAKLLWSAADRADLAVIDDPAILRLFGLKVATGLRELWRSMLEGLDGISDPSRRVLARIIDRGPLAHAILERLGPEPSRDSIIDCYKELARCLAEQRLFEP